MKNLIILTTLFISSNALALSYECKVLMARQTGNRLLSKGALTVTESLTDNGLRTIVVNGNLSVDYHFNVEDESNHTFCYSSAFANVTATERPDYRPRIYKGHSKFENIDATSSHQCDGGGMWGYLVVEKDTSKEQFKAHYVFQAGDHIGGTFDFVCTKQ